MQAVSEYLSAMESLLLSTAKHTCLDLCGLIALADISVVAERTSQIGSSCFADVLALVPGMHRQQDAANLNGAEYPITANMNSGYVFRIENEAVVRYLQRVGSTGSLTTVLVFKDASKDGWFSAILDLTGLSASILLYLASITLTLLVFAFLTLIEDRYGLLVIVLWMLSRLVNVAIIRSRQETNWHGFVHEGYDAQLIILLSQDRWIRIKGCVDHIKTVTSGQWLRNPSFLESLAQRIATFLTIFASVLAVNATQIAKIYFLLLFFINTVLISFSNHLLDSQHMKGHVLRKQDKVVKYERRLHMAHELVKESGRSDWAIKIGLINADDPIVDSISTACESKSGIVQV